MSNYAAKSDMAVEVSTSACARQDKLAFKLGETRENGLGSEARSAAGINKRR
jgi:hypothetical protein